MQLNITRIRPDDYGEYHCVAKNEVNTTTAVFYVNGKHKYYNIFVIRINSFCIIILDKRKPPNVGYSNDIAVFGSLPPKRESFEDICGPPTVCPDCPDPRDFKCKDMSITLYDLLSHLEIKPTDNFNYPGLPNRTFGKLLPV